MDKQMIEEIAKVLDGYWGKHNTCPFDKKCPYLGGSVRFTCNDCMRANAIYNAGYRKIPENAVVLTREEYKKLKHGSGTLEQLYNQYPYRVLVGFNSMVFSQDRESYEKLYDEIEKATRKETAEKFAEEVEMWKRKAIFYYNLAKDSGIYCIVDGEIEKEFTGDKI